MEPTSPLPAIASLLLAVATSWLIVKRFGVPAAQGRYGSIDGMRGYLAFFVFLHHCVIWYFALKTGHWRVPPSHLYSHFGESSVALFFMITGFLFFSKLIDGRAKKIDWSRLFISRFLRLVPLYVFVMLLLLLIVFYLSRGMLREPLPVLIKGFAVWLGFTFLGNPDLNGVAATWLIVGGVTWTLPYEWFFYLSLPLLALTVNAKISLPYVALSGAGVAGLALLWHPKIHLLYPFLGGIVASFLVRAESFRRFSARRVSSFLVVACIGMTVALFPTAFAIAPLIWLSIAFALVACGNDLFGLLVTPTARMLGQISYSIYLLQGVTLFVTFRIVLGMTRVEIWSPATYWLVILGITPILVALAFATFRLIEHPAMQRTMVFTAWLRSCLTFRSDRRI